MPQSYEDNKNNKQTGGGGSSDRSSLCLVPKIGGKSYEVFPHSLAFTIMKIKPNWSSLFDVLSNVIRERMSKPNLMGQVVVYCSAHWPAIQENNLNRDPIIWI